MTCLKRCNYYPLSKHSRAADRCVKLAPMRAIPKPLTGILVFLGCLVFFYGVWIVNGVEYDNTSDSAQTILKWMVAPLAAGASYLVWAVSALGGGAQPSLKSAKTGPAGCRSAPD